MGAPAIATVECPSDRRRSREPTRPKRLRLRPPDRPAPPPVQATTTAGGHPATNRGGTDTARPNLAARVAGPGTRCATAVTRRRLQSQADAHRRGRRPGGAAVGGQRSLSSSRPSTIGDTGGTTRRRGPTDRRNAGRLASRSRMRALRARRRRPPRPTAPSGFSAGSAADNQRQRTARGLRPRHRQLEGRRRPARPGAARDGGDVAG